MNRFIVVLLSVIHFPGAIATEANAGKENYLPSKWWPSQWGASDQRGALNRLTPEKTLAAAALITSGAIYDMGRVFEEEMPLFALTPQRRKYTLSVPGAPSWGPLGENKLVWNEDHISGHLSQDGTQFDALSHMARTWEAVEISTKSGITTVTRMRKLVRVEGLKS